MQLLKLVWLLGMLSTASAALESNFYYSTNGGFDGTCTKIKCAVCAQGEYRDKCGNYGAAATDAQRGDEGTCKACTEKPLNSAYALYPVGGTYTDATCPFTCNAGFSLVGGVCTLSACTAPPDTVTKELVPDTLFTDAISCDFRCKAGYRGNTASKPTTCTICLEGTYAAAGSTTCPLCLKGSSNGQQGQGACPLCLAGTVSAADGALQCDSCAAGKYIGTDGGTDCSLCDPGSSSSSGARACAQCEKGTYAATAGTVCTSCEVGKFGAAKGLTGCSWCDPVVGVPQYTTVVGSIACTACERCTATGYFKDSCGRASAGGCLVCTA